MIGRGSGARGGLCGNSGVNVVGASGCPELSDGLLRHLLATWDCVRELNEPVRPQRAPQLPRAQVTSVVKLGGFLSISLAHNRFCFCKGASHKSNGIYLVVDEAARTFYQKCHDP